MLLTRGNAAMLHQPFLQDLHLIMTSILIRKSLCQLGPSLATFKAISVHILLLILIPSHLQHIHKVLEHGEVLWVTWLLAKDHGLSLPFCCDLRQPLWWGLRHLLHPCKAFPLNLLVSVQALLFQLNHMAHIITTSILTKMLVEMKPVDCLSFHNSPPKQRSFKWYYLSL